MKRRTIALCDDDEKYIVKLQENLEQKDNFPFSVSTFTGVEKLKKSLTDTDYELILAEEKAFDELKKDQKLKKGNSLLVLLKERGSINASDDFIWKYQAADRIRKDILKICSEKGNSDVVFGTAEERTRLIGVFSPVGRDIQTSFSLLLGQFLAKKKKVLYLNLEPFSGLSGMSGFDPESDLTDLIYYLVTYDGILSIEYNCWLDFIIDGESITCYLCFHRSEACQDKEWSGDIFLDIKKNGNKCKISPDVTNCKSVELREYVSNTAGQGYYFDVYQ